MFVFMPFVAGSTLAALLALAAAAVPSAAYAHYSQAQT